MGDSSTPALSGDGWEQVRFEGFQSHPDPRSGSVRSSDFQARAGRQGREFEKQCRFLLHEIGFAHVSQKPFRVDELGIEIDARISTKGGRTYWCQFKGSWCGGRPGLLRTDTVKKAVADAYILKNAGTLYPPILILTSHIPKPGSSGDKMLGAAKSSGAVLDVVCVNDPIDLGRLEQLAQDWDGPEPTAGKVKRAA